MRQSLLQEKYSTFLHTGGIILNQKRTRELSPSIKCETRNHCCKIVSLTIRMTVSLNFWFEPAWQNELSKNKQEDSDENEIKVETPPEVDELILKREIEMMIGETTHPLKVSIDIKWISGFQHVKWY